MKLYFFLIILLFQTLTYSQKIIEKTWAVNDIKSIEFELNDVFNVTIKTERTNRISVKAKSEGEYANHFILNESRTSKMIRITSALDITYEDHNDKLSAHKVQAVDIQIIVPESLMVNLRSDIANIIVDGKYKQFSAQLSSGDCTLNHVRDLVNIQSIFGNIYAYTNFCIVEASSKKGALQTEELQPGKTQYYLNTVKGNITVKKRKE